MIRLVVLDMAGTTVDEGGAVYVALHDAVAADRVNVGSEVTEAAVQEWMGTEKRTAIRALTEAASGTVPDAEAVERMYVDFRARLSTAYREAPPVPVAGTEEMFTELRRRGIRIALTTGFGRDIAEPLLASLGWTTGSIGSTDSTVDAVVCGDEVAEGRPAPYLVFRAMERTGTRSVDEVLVGWGHRGRPSGRHQRRSPSRPRGHHREVVVRRSGGRTTHPPARQRRRYPRAARPLVTG